MVHKELDLQNIERELQGLVGLQANYGKSLEALSGAMKPILDLGDVKAIEALPDDVQKRLWDAALTALSETQKRSDELRQQLKTMAKTAGLTEDL